MNFCQSELDFLNRIVYYCTATSGSKKQYL